MTTKTEFLELEIEQRLKDFIISMFHPPTLRILIC